jgi:hypothetical protein
MGSPTSWLMTAANDRAAAHVGQSLLVPRDQEIDLLQVDLAAGVGTDRACPSRISVSLPGSSPYFTSMPTARTTFAHLTSSAA